MDLLDLAELITVAKDEVHVLVKGLEGANEDAAVLQDAPHPEVDVLQHLAALSNSLDKNTNTCTFTNPYMNYSITFHLARIERL